MPPIPCAHCGVNFMRVSLDPEAPRLCNNCLVREEKRTNTKKEDTMSTIDIVIKCPRQDQIEIEEYCINHGMDFTRYFLELHYGSKAAIETIKEMTAQHNKVEDGSKANLVDIEKHEVSKKKLKK